MRSKDSYDMSRNQGSTRGRATRQRGLHKLPEPICIDWLRDKISNAAPKGASGSDAFRWTYLISEVLSKYPRNTVSPEERAEAAIKKLMESEVSCARINQKGYDNRTPKSLSAAVLAYATWIIGSILGSFSFDIFANSKFTSGATTSRPRKRGDAWFKYHPTWPVYVTPRCINFGKAIIKCTPIWNASLETEPKISMGNRVSTVPKRTEIDRCIAVEPDLNMYLQTSVGGYIRGRLKKFGCDLNDQTINQRLAYEGSLYGNYATIDLASASDSISCRLVWDLLPPKWHEILDRLRSPHGHLPNGNICCWEKFSSMGNGFTFELESLIFYALTKSVLKVLDCPNSTFSVYGDDIVVSVEAASLLIDVLHDVGFETNEDKTFIEGPFRESCGKHYHNGNDVTPFYIRKPIDTVPRVVWLLNTIRKWSAGPFDICDPGLESLWFDIRRRYGPSALLGGKTFEDNTSIVSPEIPRQRLRFGCRQMPIDGWRALARSFQYRPCTIDWEDVIWSNIDHVNSMDYEGGFIKHLLPGIVRLEKNNQWWAAVPLWPKDLAKQ